MILQRYRNYNLRTAGNALIKFLSFVPGPGPELLLLHRQLQALDKGTELEGVYVGDKRPYPANAFFFVGPR